MGVFDKIRDVAGKLGDTDEGPAKGSPAAAAGGSVGARPSGAPGEVSQGGSSFEDAQTSLGGADAVPGTPDATPSTRLGTGGEDKPKHEDRRSENVSSVAPSESVAPAERDDV